MYLPRGPSLSQELWTPHCEQISLWALSWTPAWAAPTSLSHGFLRTQEDVVGAPGAEQR